MSGTHKQRLRLELWIRSVHLQMEIETMGLGESAQRARRVSKDGSDPSRIPEEPITFKEHLQDRDSL